MVMYSNYNSKTLEKLIDTVHKMHNTTTYNKKLLSSKIDSWYDNYLSNNGLGQYVKFSLII